MPPKPKTEVIQDKKPVMDIPPKGSQKFVFRTGTIYEGEYDTIDGQIYRHGFGKLIENLAPVDPYDCPGFDPIEPLPGSCRAQVFEGIWEKDVFKSGSVSYVDGSKYIGEIDAQGSYVTGGVYNFPCGSKWIGGFRGCEMHGEGYFIDKDETAWKGVMNHNNCSSAIRAPDFVYKEPSLFTNNSAVEQTTVPSVDERKVIATPHREKSGPKA